VATNGRFWVATEATALGPVTPFYGIVSGRCECGKPATARHKPGKHPRLGDWQTANATNDEGVIKQWFRDHPHSNFAVVAGVETVVLDLDVRIGKDGVSELARIEADAGATLPPTVTVLSGSGTGARHLYFKLPPNLGRLQKPKGTKGIDFLRTRQAVIVPGSLHYAGNFYDFAPGLSPEEVEIAELPDWFLELMVAPSPTKQIHVGHGDGDGLFEELLKMGPPPGSLKPGRLRSDKAVMQKMRSVPMQKYPNDRSHSDSHWAWTLARNCSHHWDQYLRIWKNSEIRKLPDSKCGRGSYEASIGLAPIFDTTG